jgi:hypothetical protein
MSAVSKARAAIARAMREMKKGTGASMVGGGALSGLANEDDHYGGLVTGALIGRAAGAGPQSNSDAARARHHRNQIPDNHDYAGPQSNLSSKRRKRREF